jgi:hypothetical protein
MVTFSTTDRTFGTMTDAPLPQKENNLKMPKGGSRIASVLIATGLLLMPGTASGQDVTFTPYSGFRLGGALSVREGDLTFNGAPIFGAQFDYRLRRDATAAFLVDYQPTTMRIRESGEPTVDLWDVNVLYFQLGGSLEVLNQSGAIPFVLGTLGMSMFDPSSGSGSSASEYGVAGIFGGGVKIPFPSGRMGLRLQARVLLNNLLIGGGSLWCSPSGCYGGVGGPIGPVQFDFGGGLTFGGR